MITLNITITKSLQTKKVILEPGAIPVHFFGYKKNLNCL